MAKSHMNKTRGATVRMKSYLYAIRPLLCCRWVIEPDSQPPILFEELLEHCLDEPEVAAEIRAMIEVKASGREFDAVDSKPALNRWMAVLLPSRVSLGKRIAGKGTTNRLIRAIRSSK
jgi:predicted nucleotidyltransferase